MNCGVSADRSIMGNITMTISFRSSMLHEATMKKIEHLKKNVEVSKTIKREAIQVTFPQEIIIEILSWMPVKSLLRMKCACKQWCALIQDRHFIEKHLSRLSLRPTIHNNRVLKGTPSGESLRLI